MNRSPRFWISGPDGSPVRVSLAEGQSIEIHGGGPHEEGFHYWRSLYAFDGLQVTAEHDTTGRDCDGRLETYTKSVCRASRLRAGALSEGIHWPAWERVDASQRDYTAEAAGY